MSRRASLAWVPSAPVPLRVVLIGGVVALLAGIAIVLSQSGHELTGTNGAKREQFVAVLHGGQRACQPNATVPAGAGRLRLQRGAYGRAGAPPRGGGGPGAGA